MTVTARMGTGGVWGVEITRAMITETNCGCNDLCLCSYGDKVVKCVKDNNSDNDTVTNLAV